MNPFEQHNDSDRHEIWDRLVSADCEAFARGDWSMIESDFDADDFEGIRCGHSADPDDWKIEFPDLASYRKSWLDASAEFRAKKFANLSHFEALLARSHLDAIDINGRRAIAHKKFFGEVALADGMKLADRRQTMFRLHKRGDKWRIVGFLGQLLLRE